MKKILKSCRRLMIFKMTIDKKILSWLTTVPSSDINFKYQLKDANLETMEEALKNIGLSKTARKAIKIQMRKLQKRKLKNENNGSS